MISDPQMIRIVRPSQAETGGGFEDSRPELAGETHYTLHNALHNF
jgi:hypothetical protein